MSTPWTSLIVFAVCYVMFVVLPHKRWVTALAGSAVLVLCGAIPWHAALFEKINWNVMGLFFGTLVLAHLFMDSRMPAVMAEWLVNRMRTLRGAMLAICLLASLLSMVVENVAVVLLVAPVALSLTERLKVSPVRIMILLAIMANLQGVATMIGDPPSMILAGAMKMSFNDFFFYHGKPGIFFAVQIGAIASTLVAAWLLRPHRGKVQVTREEKPRAWVPTILMAVLLLGLAVSSRFDPDFAWFAGTYTMLIALIGLWWSACTEGRKAWRASLRSLDWDTTFFLMGVFVIVGTLSDAGWLERLAGWLSAVLGHFPSLAFVGITLIAVLISGFVDNVPFLLAMLPVVQKVAADLHQPLPLLMFALLIGTCLGGNITPIGASANVVAVGILKRHGHTVRVGEVMAVGVPFTIAAVAASCIWLWLVWG